MISWLMFFSLDFLGALISLPKTIDTKCELCQLTDNKIEVYRIDGQNVNKVASFQSGFNLEECRWQFFWLLNAFQQKFHWQTI
jgi:hypothetical protein